MSREIYFLEDKLAYTGDVYNELIIRTDWEIQNPYMRSKKGSERFNRGGTSPKRILPGGNPYST